MKLIKELSVIEWCDQQTDEGKEIKILWDGGNDSGWVHAQIDEEDVDNEHLSAIVDKMYNKLDYGSWAGDFNATGEAVYNSEKKAFVGTDYYSVDDIVTHNCKIKITVPQEVWFDILEINIEHESNVDVEFIINNGFRTEEHKQTLEDLRLQLDDAIDVEVKEFSKTNEFTCITENIQIEYSDFIKKGNVVEFTITSLDMTVSDTEDKTIYLDLKELFADDTED